MRETLSKKIKIAVLENGLISTYTAREALMKQFVGLDFEVFVLTQTNQYTSKAEKMGVHVINIGSANFNPVRITGYIHNLWYNLVKIKPDICLTFSIRPTIWGNLVARLLQIPVISNITGTGPLFTSKSLAYKLVRKIYPFALSRTATVFFQNSEDRDCFIDRGFITYSKCRLIPGSGIDYRKFHPINIEKESAFTFLYIGRLLKDKGVPEFIDAARMIKKIHPEVRFKIIGPLWKQNMRSNTISETEIRQWVGEGIIEYIGEKPDIRMDIARADCVVLPSHREGTSNVLLEASAMERPCIATDVPGCREIIKHEVTGYLCKLKNSNDLALQMDKMLSLDPDIRLQMGRSAREKVIREFDKQIVINRYFEEIDDILLRNHYPVYTLYRHQGKAVSEAAYPQAI